jgi:hypothetical protein
MRDKDFSMTDSDRAIGRLEGKFDLLLAKVEEGQRESKDGRRKIYEELEAIRADAATTRVQVAGVKDRIDKAEPVLTEIGKWRERFNGMIMLIGAVSALFGGAVALSWKWIATKLGL